MPITNRFGRVIPVSCFTHQHHEVMRQGAGEPSPKSNSVRGNILNSIQTLARNEFQIQGSKTLNVHTLRNCSYDPFTATLGMVSYRFYHVLPHYMSIHPSHSHPFCFDHPRHLLNGIMSKEKVPMCQGWRWWRDGGEMAESWRRDGSEAQRRVKLTHRCHRCGQKHQH